MFLCHVDEPGSPALDHFALTDFSFIVASQEEQAYSSDGLTRDL
jgi:hypothetical protein